MSRLLRTASAIGTFMYRRGLVRKMGKMQQVLLTTVGRQSGKPRTVPLGAVPEGDGWVVIGSAGGGRPAPQGWGGKGRAPPRAAPGEGGPHESQEEEEHNHAAPGPNRASGRRRGGQTGHT